MFRTALFLGALLVAGSPAFAQSEPVADRVEVNGMQVYYEVSGTGDPLIVLHGAYMNIPSMGRIIPMLAETHKVYALEFQGHGRTTNIDRPITYPNLADDVAAFDVLGEGVLLHELRDFVQHRGLALGQPVGGARAHFRGAHVTRPSCETRLQLKTWRGA